MPTRLNESFGEAVRQVLGGLSLRQTRIRTGVDIDTVSRMRAGEVPRVDKVIDFARGFGLDVNEWLELAGYPRIDDARPPLAVIREKARELTYEPEGDVSAVGLEGELSPASQEVLKRIERALREEERGLAK